MLEKPDLPDSLLISRLQAEYGLQGARVTFLPLGADINNAVYRVDALDKTYFLKLRKGVFTDITVTLPLYLNGQGIQAVIAPLPGRSTLYWTDLGDYKIILYPFLEGNNGYESALSEIQWREFAAALKRIHTIHLPPALSEQIPRESFSPIFREMVIGFQEQAEHPLLTDPTAIKFAAFMRAKRNEIDALVGQADHLGRILQRKQPELVLCHSDIHAGNVLLGANNELYIVDWDNPIFAPKEHDLAMVGGSAVWSSPRHVNLFYQGYGQSKIDLTALTYYRSERIILDIAEFSEQLLISPAGGEDREQSFQYFTSIFLPNHEIELALNSDLTR